MLIKFNDTGGRVIAIEADSVLAVFVSYGVVCINTTDSSNNIKDSVEECVDKINTAKGLSAAAYTTDGAKKQITKQVGGLAEKMPEIMLWGSAFGL